MPVERERQDMSVVVTQVGGDLVDPFVADGELAAPIRRDQRGMVSAEWAVGIIAAIAIAGVLLAVVTNGAVKAALLSFLLGVIHTFSGKL